MIVSNPSVMMGKPVIVGTGVTLELILEKLAAGETVQQILEAHPQLNEDAVRAALAFAADALRAVVIYPLETIPRCSRDLAWDHGRGRADGEPDFGERIDHG
jgi:uncharacterized protein (DUF433 family)